MDTYVIYNPNAAKKRRKRKKQHERESPITDTFPISHTTRNGRGRVGMLIRKRKAK